MRRISLLTLLIVCLAAIHGGSASAQTAGVATVTSSDGVNLRTAPNTQAQVVTAIPFGSVINLGGPATPDGWYQVTFGGLSGWADGAYLTLGVVNPNAAQNAVPLAGAGSSTPIPTATATTPATSTPTAVASTSGATTTNQSGSLSASSSSSAAALFATMLVNTDALRLRATPDPNGQVETTMPMGALVQVTGPAVAGSWEPVTYNGLSGWCDSSYLKAPSLVQGGWSPQLGVLANGLGSNSASGSAAASGASFTSAMADAATLASFGNPKLGSPAGPEAGLPVATAPAGTLGKFVWPVASRNISTTFQSSHQAIDIDEFPSGGQSVSAIADGVVTFAGGDACCSYGLYVIIQHANGFSSLYAHFSKTEVSVGQSIHQSQELGLSGCTGNCTGPHLHFAIYLNGNPLDPLTVLPAGGQIEPGANCYRGC